eukprot:CAMPEP_0172520340 /NCGR_PEP_ID=MMETSP1066-20121228/291947_1 /TAXON_ID=671091 /ORGANISM="Coscinodiscus wailesii, Strain CCMP2513" /LENGTH=326 /DNA_ID=CAMNT_0013303081 /DNA_START=56 /DNA_END=1032 /DNA_ORIENTATION=+
MVLRNYRAWCFAWLFFSLLFIHKFMVYYEREAYKEIIDRLESLEKNLSLLDKIIADVRSFEHQVRSHAIKPQDIDSNLQEADDRVALLSSELSIRPLVTNVDDQGQDDGMVTEHSIGESKIRSKEENETYLKEDTNMNPYFRKEAGSNTNSKRVERENAASDQSHESFTISSDTERIGSDQGSSKRELVESRYTSKLSGYLHHSSQIERKRHIIAHPRNKYTSNLNPPINPTGRSLPSDSILCDEALLVILVHTFLYPEKLSWALTMVSSGEMIIKRDPGMFLYEYAEYWDYFCLSPGIYTFYIDGYGSYELSMRRDDTETLKGST